jgi:hypothetical protein
MQLKVTEMQYFKCLNPSSPVFYAVEEALGPKGAWESLKAVSHALMLNVNKMDEKTVVHGAGVKRDRAKRLLPFAQEILSETQKIYKKSTQKVSENYQESSENVPEMYQESDQNLPDLPRSNPHGSTRVKEEDKDKEEDINKNKSKKEKSSFAPESFHINEMLQQWLDGKNYPRAWAENEIEGFLDYHRNKQSKFTDWNAAFRTWCKNGESYGSLKRWNDKNLSSVGTSKKHECPSFGDPDYERKMANYLASIPVGFAEYKNRGN